MGWSRLREAGSAEGRTPHSFPQRAPGRSRNPRSWALSSGRDRTPRHEASQDLQMQGTGQLSSPHPDPKGLTAVCQCSAPGAGDTQGVFKGVCMLAATSTHQCELALLVCFEVQPSLSLVNIPKRGVRSTPVLFTGGATHRRKKKEEKEHTCVHSRFCGFIFKIAF